MSLKTPLRPTVKLRPAVRRRKAKQRQIIRSSINRAAYDKVVWSDALHERGPCCSCYCDHHRHRALGVDKDETCFLCLHNWECTFEYCKICRYISIS